VGGGGGGGGVWGGGGGGGFKGSINNRKENLWGLSLWQFLQKDQLLVDSKITFACGPGKGGGSFRTEGGSSARILPPGRSVITDLSEKRKELE